MGYWLVASGGGDFRFADAGFVGRAGGTVLVVPIIGTEPSTNGAGYTL